MQNVTVIVNVNIIYIKLLESCFFFFLKKKEKNILIDTFKILVLTSNNIILRG